MAFLTPLAVIAAALAIPILLLYMLRLRRREVVVSSTFLWGQVLQDREANTPWQRLRRNLLLLLQLLILLLLVLALMRPYITVPAVSAGQIAVLIDASASMNATDSADGTRFAEAQRRALEVVDTMRAGDSMTVIRVGAVPEVLSPYTDDRAALRAAIQNAAPGRAAGDWNAALTLAAAGALGSEDFAAVIISDGGIDEADSLPAIPGALQYLPVGASGSNTAITALATRALPGQPPQAFAQITNYGDADADVIFSLRADGALIAADSYTIPAGTILTPPIDALPVGFAALEAAITFPAGSAYRDYLPTDNAAWTVSEASAARRAILITEGNLFLEQVMRILPAVQTFQGTPDRGLPSGDYDVYIFDNYTPTTLPDGDLLFINPPVTLPGLFQVGAESEAAGNPRVADDPRLAFVDFSTVNIRAFRQVTAEWAEPLIAADGGALLLAGEIGDRQIAILTFALADSDLPLQIAFPVLISALLDWFQPPGALADSAGVRAGEPLSIRLAGDIDAGRVIAPDGTMRPLTGEGAERFFAATDLPGLYMLELFANGEVVERAPFAVNSFDPAESRIAPRQTVTLGESTLDDQVEQTFGQQEFWSWLALAALIVLLIEWVAYHRRLNGPTLLQPLVRRANAGVR
ncbi:MAG: VWA domain-containing protein [bacterium]|nr:VWA domain-containing protein [bacterium]